MEHKLGEIFEDGGVKLKVEKSINRCRGCHFLHVTHCVKNSFVETCDSLLRKDNTDVIFVKVKDNTNNNKDMETRNIKLDLNTAKEWYKGSDETLKKLALQAYKEEELEDKLPKTWEEFCENNKSAKGDFYIREDSYIERINIPLKRDVYGERNLLPSKESAEAHLALMQLERLRDCYRGGWEPDWSDGEPKYVILNYMGKISPYRAWSISHILSFQQEELRDKFFDNFKDLIETAKDLI